MPLYGLGDRRPVLPEPEQFWVAPDATLIGDIALARDVSVWFGAILRGDNERISLGEGTNVQDGCVMHTDMGYPLTTGRNCTLGHHAVLHGCTLGDDVLIGMGSTVMNGAVVKAGSLVGAGTLITEGKTFPERSLIVGSPARVLRFLDESAVEKIRMVALGYARNWKRYAAGLHRLD